MHLPGRILITTLLSLAMLLSSAGAALALPLITPPQSGRLDIAGLVEYRLDQGGGLTFPQAQKSGPAGPWKTAGPAGLDFKFSQAAVWLRFALVNHSARNRLIFLSVGRPSLDRADIFLAYANGRVEHLTAGDTLPVSDRAVDHRGFVFPVNLPPKGLVVCHLRAVSSSDLSLPLELFTPEALASSGTRQGFWLGLYFGALVIMALTNLFLFLRLKEKNYLYYLAYAVGLGLAMLSFTGLAAQHLWPGNPWWADRSTPFLLCLAMVWGLLFCRGFLATRQCLPALDKGFLALVWLNLAGMFLALLVEVRWTAIYQNNLLLLSATYSLTAGVMVLRQGRQAARFFLLAWAMMAAGSMAHALRVAGVAPSVFVTDYGLVLGSGLELLFLSFALAEKMGLMGREREAALAGKLHFEDLSRRDALTGLFNRRYFLSLLKNETRESLRQGRPLSLIILDLDDFKHFNDTHGHPEGDRALKALAEVLAASLREGDAAGRYGGEEFVAMLPGADRDQAWAVAERIRESLAGRALCVAQGQVFVTASLGLAELACDEESGELLRRADQALYQAKKKGKNRTQAA